MELYISNMIAIKDPTQKIKDYCYSKLIIDNPSYITAQKLGKYVGRMPKTIRLFYEKDNELVLPFGCLNEINKLIDLRSCKYRLNFAEEHRHNMVGEIILYDYQLKAENALFKSRSGILEAPCGSGKTNIGLQLIKDLGLKALWITHTHKLLEQSLERCKANFLGDFGTITEGKIKIGKDITFATIQTLSKIDYSIYENEFNVVIVDECHHCVGTPSQFYQFYKVLSHLKARYKFGMSATLNRVDGLTPTMFSILGEKVYTITKEEVGEKIIKADYEPIFIDLDYDLMQYVNTDGTIDYMKLITMLSNDSNRNEIIIANILAVNKDKQQLVLCHRVSQVEYLYNKLKELNIDTCMITSKVKDRTLDNKVIVATYQLAKEGLDIPTLSVLHLATPQKNEGTTKQCAGRVERNIEGKETPIIYDYIDSNIPYCVGCYKKRRRILK